MPINTLFGGVRKPVKKEVSILWYAPSGTVDLDEITASVDLASIGLIEAGAITTDGVTSAANASEPEVYLDWSGNAFDSGEATSTPSLTFSLLELLNPSALRLIYASSAIITGTDGKLKEIRGSGTPGNMTLVTVGRIKNTREIVIRPENSFASKGDENMVNDALASIEVTWNTLVGPDGVDIVRRYGDIA